ncbi:MAG: UbiA prenyltransferase family protein [Sulfurihydrogenibium sp.]
MKEYLKLIRIKSYIKNVLIFAPAFFAGVYNLNSFFILGLGFVAFSLTASLVYIINDIVDVENDRKHPVKKHRPLASGRISILSAKVLMFSIIILILVLSAVIKNTMFTITLIVYLIVNVAYSFYLKNIPLVDLITLSVSYILRLLAGAFLVNVMLSPWIILVTVGLSILLGAGKRLEDVILMENNGVITRKVVKDYSVEFLKMIIIFSSFYVVFTYTIYSVLVYPDKLVYLTNIFVFIGFLRYFQIIFHKKVYYDPITILLKDNILKFIVVLWLVSFYVLKDFRWSY